MAGRKQWANRDLSALQQRNAVAWAVAVGRSRLFISPLSSPASVGTRTTPVGSVETNRPNYDLHHTARFVHRSKGRTCAQALAQAADVSGIGEEYAKSHVDGQDHPKTRQFPCGL